MGTYYNHNHTEYNRAPLYCTTVHTRRSGKNTSGKNTSVPYTLLSQMYRLGVPNHRFYTLTLLLYTRKDGVLVVFCGYLSNIFTSSWTSHLLLKLWLGRILLHHVVLLKTMAQCHPLCKNMWSVTHESVKRSLQSSQLVMHFYKVMYFVQ